MSDITDKIGALLAKAEATDNEHERDAYTAKAQGLATTYAIDLELARQRQRTKTKREVPEVRTIRIAKSGQKNARHLAMLFLAIGKVNDVKFDIAHNNTYVVAFGYPSDIDVTERLYASLLVQMTRACDTAITNGEHKLRENLYWREERWDSRTYRWIEGGYRADARVFRTSFYEGFIGHLAERLRAAQRTAEQAVVTTVDETGDEVQSTGELVLVGKREEVKSFHKERSEAQGTWSGYKASNNSSFGARQAGSRAAASANLHGTQHSLPGSPGRISA